MINLIDISKIINSIDIIHLILNIKLANLAVFLLS